MTGWGVHRLADVIGSKNCTTPIRRDGCEVWVRAASSPYDGNRFKAAWMVLVGKAYAFHWPEPGDLEKALER